jgi:hypothetical protein
MADSNVEVLGMYAWYSTTEVPGLIELNWTEQCHKMVIISPFLSMSPYHKEKSAKSEKHKICIVFCI